MGAASGGGASERGLDRDRISADPDGSLVAVVDGAELLAWAGHDLQPIWKAFGEARYADLAVATDGVWALGLDGVIEQRRRADGELLLRARWFQGGGAAVAARAGLVVAAGAEGVAWCRADASALASTGGRVAAGAARVTGRVALPDVMAVALSEDGRRAALLERGGALTVLDMERGEVTGRVTVGGAPAAVAWSPEGCWCVAVQQRLRPVRADGGAVAAPRPAQPARVRHVAVAGDGAVWALGVGASEVALVGPDGDVALGGVTVGRAVSGVATGGRGVLFIGLDHGEVQRVDLLSGQAIASAPHEGRARVPWASDVRVDQGRLRGLLARRQAGRAELAVQLDPDVVEDELSWWTVALWASAALAVVVLALGIAWWILRGRGLL